MSPTLEFDEQALASRLLRLGEGERHMQIELAPHSCKTPVAHHDGRPAWGHTKSGAKKRPLRGV